VISGKTTTNSSKKDQRPIEDSNRKIKKTDFNYDEDKDCFVCPAGHALELKAESSDGKKIVEPVFGQIKNSGFRGFLLRGYEKASGEFSLACAVHNFKKIVKAILCEKVCLDSEGLAPMVA
jgi:hypothetical protein